MLALFLPPAQDQLLQYAAVAKPWAVGFIPPLIGALLVLLIGTVAAKLARRVLVKALGRAGIDATLQSFLGNLVYMALMALVVITTLGQLGVPTGSFAAIIAAAGLAVGFALQGSLGNFASGVMLMIFRPFKKGDFISAGGVDGVVQDIQIFSTVLCTGDNRVIILPNGQITAGAITNFSARETRRIDMVFGIGYGDDIAKAKAVIERVLKADSRILAEPAYTIACSELADSSVDFVVRPWVKGSDYWPTRFALTEQMKLEFDKEGISIPFPQRDVHIHQVA